MKIQILNKQGKKVSEKETKLFEEPIRKDIILKVIEAEKVWQPWSPKFRAGMNRSASGNVRHRRHVWKSDRGRGLARIPKKASWRRGTQFSWEGAIIPGTKGGRRAHPPKGIVNDKKINKKELKKALMSALTYVSSIEDVKNKYGSLKYKDVKIELPLVVESKILSLKGREFLDILEKLLGGFYDIAIKKKSVRAGIGKMRGRKYKKNAGLLVVIGKNEDLKVKGIDIINISELIVGDLASNGARLCMFSENAINELEEFLIGSKKKVGKKVREKRVDKRKLKKEKRKKIIVKKSKDKNKGNLKKDKIISNLQNNKVSKLKENKNNPNVAVNTNEKSENLSRSKQINKDKNEVKEDA